METVAITKMTPSSISAQSGDKTVIIQGEAYLRGYGSPDFVAYRSSLRIQDGNGLEIEVTNADQEEILAGIANAMAVRKQTIEFE